jgi:hypothetical protein
MKKHLIVMLSLSALACATGYNPRYSFNEIQVVNLSAGMIANVRIGFVGSPRTLACDEVAKYAMCADRFAGRYYPQQGIELSWTHTDGSRKSDLFAPAIPVTFNPVFPLRIVMEVNADGSVKPFYEQEEPSRSFDL